MRWGGTIHVVQCYAVGGGLSMWFNVNYALTNIFAWLIINR